MIKRFDNNIYLGVNYKRHNKLYDQKFLSIALI